MTGKLLATGERALPKMSGDVALEHLHRYALAQQLAQGKRVLDIACGEGYGSALLAQVAQSVVGVDISPEAVRHAAEAYRADNLTFQAGSCSQIPLPDASVDLVVSFETLEHHDQHEEMLAEIKRVLVPEGILLMSTPDRTYYSEEPGYRNPYHIKELNKREFADLLSRYFRHARFAGQRIVYSSCLVFDPPERQQQVRLFSGDFTSVTFRETLSKPLYIVALASDHLLPDTDALSLFEYTDGPRINSGVLAELQAIRNSASWRITAPLRWLGRQFVGGQP